VERKKRFRKLLLMTLMLALMVDLAVGSLGAATASAAQNIGILTDEKIGSGVNYAEEDITDYYGTGNRVRVNRLNIDLNDPYTQVISSKALETVNAMETIGKQADREILKGNNVVAGINADMYHMSTGMPLGIMIKDGELITSHGPDERSGAYRASFFVDGGNVPSIAPLHAEGRLSVNESVHEVDLFNRNQGVMDALVLHTSDITRNHKLTHTEAGMAGNAAFALIRVDNFNGVYPGQEYTGYIEEVYTKDGFEIPGNYVALAGYGTKKAEVESLSIGDEVSFVYNLYVDQDTTPNNDITASIASNTWLVRDGQALTLDDMPDKSAFTTAPNARTAIGIKEDGSVVVVTADKPSSTFSDSIGTNLPDLAKYMKDAGSVNAVNLDGGGSTEMIVRKAGSSSPVTVNHPSDGNSRVVTNSLLFVNTAAKTGVVGNVVVDKNISIYKGSSYHFSYRVTDEFGNPINDSTGNVQWSATTGSIDENGRFTAPQESGSGEVTATINGATGSAKVTAVDSFASIQFTANTSVVMQKNETRQFDFIALDSTGSNVVIDPSLAEWSLSGDIGTVSKEGVVTATVDHGAGTLTATIGGQTVTLSISVGLKEQIIDDFESYPIEGYHLSGFGYGSVTQYAGSLGSSTKLSFSTDIKHSGTRSFKMDYDFADWKKTANGTLNWIPHWYTDPKWSNELTAQMYATYKTDVYPRKFGAWIYGDGKAPWLRAIFQDGLGNNKTIDLTSDSDDINWIGWKYLEVKIPEGWALPIKLNYLYSVETNKLKDPYAGTIYFDDLKFLYTDEVTDFSGPEFTQTTPSGNQIYSSTLDFSTIISDNLSGVDKNKITVKVNDAHQAYTYDESTGRLSFKLENLAEGDYRVYVDAYDVTGNQSVPWIETTYRVDLSPDTEAPTISDVTPTSDVTVKIPTPRITFNIQDQKSKVNAASISVKLNGTMLPVYYDASTGWSYALPESKLADGAYTLTIDAQDHAGNALPTYSDQLTVASIAQPQDSENFSISVIPDTQGNAFTERIFKRAAADDSSLAIHLGDIVDDGSQKQYDEAAQFAALFGSKPLFVLAGNHEAFQNTLNLFYKMFGSPTLHFEYGNSLIILLNSAFGQSISGSDSTQFHYLEAVLAKNTKKNVFVFNHVITRDDYGTAHEMGSADVAKLESILSGYKSKHTDVNMKVLFGHLHNLQSWEVGQVEYIIGGNGANKGYVSDREGNLLGSGKITVAGGSMSYSYDPLLSAVYIRNEALIAGKMKSVVGSQVQLDLYGDFRESPSQYMAQLNNHKLVNIAWQSSNDNVASVDANGVVTAKASGSVTITATSGGKSNSITVETVKPADVKPVKLELIVSQSIKVGEQVIPTLKATDAYGAVYAMDTRDVAFSFANNKVSLTSSGKLIGKALGYEVITATFAGLKATANVTVTAQSPSLPDGWTDGSTSVPSTPNVDRVIDISSGSNVPSSVFADLGKTSGGSLTFAGSNYKWILKSEDVTEQAAADSVDLGVKLVEHGVVGKIATPVQVNKDKVAFGISLNHSGAYPGKMMLEINAGGAYAGQTLDLYRLDSVNPPALLGKFTVDKDGKLAIPFTSGSAAEYILTSQSIKNFADVNNHWAKDYIYYLAGRDIVSGMSDSQFSPDNNITRSEFVRILAGIAGADVSAHAGSGFSDVSASAWYAPYVSWAYEKGIVAGIDADSFAPDASITREQMAAMVLRLTNLLGHTLEERESPVKFQDDVLISHYAAEAVAKMQKAGIIKGMPNQTFAPNKTAIRGEAATMLANLLKWIEARQS